MMKYLKQAFAGLVAMIIIAAGCMPSAQSPQVDPQVVAQSAAKLLADGWADVANGCVAVAQVKHDDSIRQGCQKTLDPILSEIKALGAMADAWQAADQQNYSCLASNVIVGLQQALAGVPGLVLPPAVQQGLVLLGQFTPACLMADAGAQ